MQLLNQQQAAEYLCVSTSKLYKMTHKREIPFIKMGSKNIFSIDDLSEYILSNRMLTAGQLREQAFNNLNQNRK